MIFRRKRDEGQSAGATTVAEPEPAPIDALEAELGLPAAIDRLVETNARERSPELDRRILALRHRYGIELLKAGTAGTGRPQPDPTGLNLVDGVPEIKPAELTPELLRSAILGHGCLLIRGLMEPASAAAFAEGIEGSFRDRTAIEAGEAPGDPLYESFVPEPPYTVEHRGWIAEGGGVLACDSPKLMFDMLRSFRDSGLTDVIETYLGETPVVSAEKCTLRKADPSVTGAWHQDGKFMGPVNAMNIWVSLSRCGDVAPGLDLIPKRFDDYVENGTREAKMPNQVPQSVADEVAAGVGIVRPVFEPGDVMLFDEMFLHQTGSEPSMPNPRYAIESWFFGPSAFPGGYLPIVV